MSLTHAAGSNPHIVGIRPVALSHFLPPEASECASLSLLSLIIFPTFRRLNACHF